MPELLKNFYNSSFFDSLCSDSKLIVPDFDKSKFLKLIMDENWENLELKQRMSHTAYVFRKFLKSDYAEAVGQILELTELIKSKKYKNTFPYIFIPDIIEKYGLNNFQTSIQAMEKITTLISCEFAIRPFIIKYQDEIFPVLLKWSKSENEHVRRLASEGCRPRLPWAMSVPYLKKNPSPIFPILENLKEDKSEYVRRSVANNLNDISKDHPSVVLELAKKWAGKSGETDKILKHACRTLIKKGDENCLKIFGFEKKGSIKNCQLKLDKENYTIGDVLTFEFKGLAVDNTELRLQFIVDFVKSTGKSGKKIFFLGEIKVSKNQQLSFKKNIRLSHFTTRKLYAGLHKIDIMVNGELVADEYFNLFIP